MTGGRVKGRRSGTKVTKSQTLREGKRLWIDGQSVLEGGVSSEGSGGFDRR